MSINLSECFADIANAIREKDGTTDPIKAKEFPMRIESMISTDINKELFIEVLVGDVTNIKASDLKGANKIGYQAFAGCTKLETITLPNSITSIERNAFEGCINLKIINVPWVEGAIAGAPWGATNAVINYNYGG